MALVSSLLAQDLKVTDSDSVKSALQKHTAYIEQMLFLIPEQFYFPVEHDDNAWKNRFQKHQPSVQAKKKAIHKSNRFQKLDPSQAKKSLLEIQKDRSQQTQARLDQGEDEFAFDDSDEESDSDGEMNGDDDDADRQLSDDHDNDDHDNDDDDDDDDEGAATLARTEFGGHEERSDVPSSLVGQEESGSLARTPAELRERLRARIDSLKQQRGLTPGREKQLKLVAHKRRKEKKEKRKRRREAVGKTQRPTGADNTLTDESSSKDDLRPTKRSKPDQDLEFGTFDFSTDKPTPSYLLKKRKATSARNPRTTEALLQKAEMERDYIQQIKDVDLRKQVIEKRDWERATKMAAGEKIKDDPALLRKTLRRQKQQKQRSAKKWSDRTKGVKIAQKAQQDRRESNIQARAEQKKAKKAGKKLPIAKKRPGFEGKKKNFLNKKKKK